MSPTINKTHEVTLEDLRGDIESLKADLAALGQDAKGVAASAAGSAVSKVKEQADAGMECLKHAGEEASAYHDSFRNKVAQHPTASVLLAVGVGALVGRMLVK